MGLPEWLQRLVAEATELEDKMSKLQDFLRSDKTSEISQEALGLLQEQYKAMGTYLAILVRRIELY